MEYNNNLYQSNLLRLLTQNDLTEINNSIDNVINTEIPQQINNSIIYGTSRTNDTNTPKVINIGTPYRYVIIVAWGGVGNYLLTGIFSANDSSMSFTGGGVGHGVSYTNLAIASITSTSFNVRYYSHDSHSTSYPYASISYIAFI